MKPRILLVILVIIVLTMILASCLVVDPSLPVYEKTDEDGTSVYIDGVRYKELHELKWELILTYQSYEIIGYAGDRNTSITIDHTDTERNFIFLNGRMLYRADRNIPDVSVESVDNIEWEDYVVENDEIKNEYKNTIEDKEIIIELFDLLDTGERTEKFDPIRNDSKSWVMALFIV